MAIAIQWLVRNFELRTIIAGIVQIAGKASVLEVLADIKDKKHSLVNAVVSEMVPSICTENNQIIAAPLQQTGRHRNIGFDLIRHNNFINLVTACTNHTDLLNKAPRSA